MNGVPGPVWREARNHDGRVYYYNDQGQTQWTKPEALMAPAEVTDVSSHEEVR